MPDTRRAQAFWRQASADMQVAETPNLPELVVSQFTKALLTLLGQLPLAQTGSERALGIRPLVGLHAGATQRRWWPDRFEVVRVGCRSRVVRGTAWYGSSAL